MSPLPRAHRFRARNERAVAGPLLALVVLVVAPVVVVAGLVVGIPPTSGTPPPFERPGPLSVSILNVHSRSCFVVSFSPPTCRSLDLFATAHGGLPPYTFAWDFGDGSGPAFGAAVTHTFPACGIYNVTVVVVTFQGTASNSTRVFPCPPS